MGASGHVGKRLLLGSSGLCDIGTDEVNAREGAKCRAVDGIAPLWTKAVSVSERPANYLLSGSSRLW